MVKPFKEVYRFRTFAIEGQECPTVLLGSSPFIGAAQFGARALVYRARFLFRPENMVKLIRYCVDLGVNAVQAVGYPEVLEAVQEVMRESRTEIFILGTVGLGNIEREMDLMLGAGAKGIVVHGSLADGRAEWVRRCLARLRDEGVITGVATHKPGLTIPLVEYMQEVQVILAPVNRLGRYMEPSFESSLKSIEGSSKRIIAIKPLAGGRLSPEEGLEYLAGKVDGIAVGISSLEEAGETFEVARKFFS